MFKNVDFHSHILPCMDDGASSEEESLKLLKLLKAQGINKVFATPHFIASRESVSDFIVRRAKSFDKISNAVNKLSQEVLLGAEIAFSPELYKLKDLKDLNMGNIKYIMIELPFAPYASFYNNAIENIYYETGLRPIIAHIDRYMSLFSKDDYKKLFSVYNAVFQINTDISESFYGKKFLNKLIKYELPLVFGSDAHNTDKRVPKFDKLYKSRLFKNTSKTEYLDALSEYICSKRNS